MAEIAVQTVIQLLGPLIKDEVRLLKRLKDDAKIIANELDHMNVFLDIADERAIADKESKHWVTRVRSLAYDIEDAVEEYQLYEKSSAWDKLYKYMSLHVHSMATNFKLIRKMVVEMRRDRDIYKPLCNTSAFLENVGSSDSQSSTITDSSSLETFMQCEVVGIEIPKREITELLVRRNYDKARSTVAVVGMRGIGKTTLVYYVCNEPNVREQFPMCAMISMSQKRRRYRHEENRRLSILRSMMKQFYNADLNSLENLASLQNKINKCLMATRYLIVFDDAREGDIDMMHYLKQVVLPENTHSSKILVTTRNETVARAWLDNGCDHPYALRNLSRENAWLLFRKFQTYEGFRETCPPYLESLARRIVRKCDGLPPAIVAIGRLLSTKLNDYNEWKKVHDNLTYYLQKNNHLTGIYDILTSNYYDIPCHLKPCFLYFGVFPKGYKVEKMRLIRLWIAEGFITKINRVNLTLEDVAEEYLERLVSMSLVEVIDRDPIDQRPKTFRVNDFLHEMLLSKLDELRFCQIISEYHCCASDDEQLPHRRLSIHKLNHVCEFLTTTRKTNSKIRSLFDFDERQDTLAKVVNTTLLNNVVLLKVLDLYGAPISDIPLALGNLRNLRYLSLRNTHVKKLPSSIGMLQDLQTLDLKYTKICVVPNEINKLHMLRHLLIYGYEPDFQYSPHVSKVSGLRMPGWALNNFKDLQKLAYLDLGNGTTNVTHLTELTKLRRLAIIGLESKDGKDLCAVVQEMKNLQAFIVYAKDREMLDLNPTSLRPPQTLKRLYLNGPLKGFPRWIFDLQNLMKIHLRWSDLNHEERFYNLGVLPNLVELQLLEAYNGELLEFTNEGFKKLKILSLLDLHSLEFLIINEGALPVLEELSMGESPKFVTFLGTQYLRNLKKVTFFDMPLDFIDLFQKCQSNYDAVEHGFDVSLKFKSEEGYWI